MRLLTLASVISVAGVPACLTTHVPEEVLPAAPDDGAAANQAGGDAAAPVADVPALPWDPVPDTPARFDGECGNVTFMHVSRHDDRILVGVANRGLFETSDGMESWQELGAGPGSQPFENLPSSLVEDPDNADEYWVTGIYGDFGLFHTVDRGRTFHIVGADVYDPERPERVIIRHNDAVGIDFADDSRSTMLISGHEALQTLWRSQDGGESWVNVGLHLPEESGISSGVAVLDANTFLVGVRTWTQPPGVFRSADAGQSWEKVYPEGTIGRPATTEAGSLYWALEGKRGVIRSADAGETWERVLEYQEDVPPLILPGDVLAAVLNSVEVSDDGGDSWQPVTSPRPYQPSNLLYHASTGRLLVNRGFCVPDEPQNAIMTYDFALK